uniref:Uncharacterized protein n=1 Tax=Mycobacterium riyadhense TaxID=486698 RepID=A0A653F4C4_9MYCO|nr:hypothetical protein BIN_B_05353 [Mycobacterium riyadhense]
MGSGLAECPGQPPTTPQSGLAAIDAHRGRPTLPAVATIAHQQTTGAAGTSGRTGPAGASGPAVSEPPCVTAGTAGLPGAAGGAVATVSVQQPAVLAAPARHRCVGPVADQRAAQQRPGGRVDNAERLLLNALK